MSPSPSPLVIPDTQISTPLDTSADLTPLANAPAGVNLDYPVGTQIPAAHGTFTVLSGNRLRYTPNPGYSGPDSTVITAVDPLGRRTTFTVNVTVIPGAWAVAHGACTVLAQSG